MSVSVVTDSTAYLPPVEGISVVPLTVVVNGVEGLEGIDVTPAEVARAMTARRVSVTTSRPAPAEFEALYRSLLAAGADRRRVGAPVGGAVRDGGGGHARRRRRSTGPSRWSTPGRPGWGWASRRWRPRPRRRRASSLAEVRDAALAAVERTSTFFYVDTLEFLRRGGRINAASALLGTALSVKPILHVVDGEVKMRDRVRTAGRALARLVDLAVEAAGDSDVDVGVHHLGAPERANDLTAALASRLDGRLREVYVSEIGAVVAAHVGPGLACVVVHRRP